MAKIIIEREKCIGCGTCMVVCPKYFELIEDGKSHIKGAEKKEIEELEIDRLECAESASESCPVQCIKIEK